MAAPKYPKILLQTDWDKNKGLIAKAVGTTNVGQAMKDLKKAYDGVDWDKVDSKKALAGGVTSERAKTALKEAQDEWDKKVLPLIAKASTVNTRALNAIAKYKSAKIPVPKSSVTHALNVQKAAVTFEQELRNVRKEVDKFKTVKKSDTVETVVGREWFARVMRVELHDHPDMLAFANARGATLGLNGKVDPELAKHHKAFKDNMAKWGRAMNELQALRPKKMERAAAIKTTLNVWLEATDAFFPMAGGTQASLGLWVDRLKRLVGERNFRQWIQANQELWATAEEAGETMTSLAPDLMKLGEHIEGLR
jgi:hypothetical protein